MAKQVYTFAVKEFTVQQGYEELQVRDGKLELDGPATPSQLALIEQFGGKLEKEPAPTETQKLTPPSKKKSDKEAKD